MGEKKRGKSRKNITGFISILALAILVIFMFNFVAAWKSHVFTATETQVFNYSLISGLPINEDVEHTFNITINNTASWNVTGIFVYLWDNFLFTGQSTNKTFNITLASLNFSNNSNTLMWNSTIPTGDGLMYYLLPANLSANGSTISFNATAYTPGKYNITVRILYNNTAFLYNETNVSVYVNDTTAPYYTEPTSTISHFSNVSGVIVLNFSSFDNGNLTAGAREYDVQSINVTIRNASGGVNNSYIASNVSGKYWNVSINTSQFSDGIYNISLSTNDTKNNINLSSFNVTFDNTDPVASIECSPIDAYVGGTVTCTCSSSDATSGLSSTTYTASPSTENAGIDLTEDCVVTDRAGNTITVTSNKYNIWGQDGGGSSGGGSSTQTYTKTVPMNVQEFSQVQSIETSSFSGGGLGARERVTFKINNEQHYVGVKSLTSTSAVIEISSTPIQLNMAVGQDTKQDLDGDGYYDVYVKLNNIVNGKADLTIQYLHEQIVSGTETTGETPTTIPETTGEEIAEQPIPIWAWILIGAVVIIIAGTLILLKKKKRK